MTRYELLERIGAGGMAEIFRGKAVAAGGFEKPVAIKRILPHLSQDRRFVELLIAEAKILSQLRHRNIVQIFDVGLGDDNQHFLVMEFVDGMDLGKIQRGLEGRRKRLPLDLVLHIGAEICEALQHAHSAPAPDGTPMRLVHRDVSPSNVLISRSGEVKLTDFGIAKRPEEHTGQHGVRGKFAYISPEQAENRHVDARSDVFSVGVLLFELALGHRLFSHLPDFEALKAVRDGKIPAPTDIDPALSKDVDQVLRSALARDPSARFATAGELGARLRTVRYSLETTAGDPATELARIVASLELSREPEPKPKQAAGKRRRPQSSIGFEPGEPTVVRIRTADAFAAPEGDSTAILRARQLLDRFEEEETRLARVGRGPFPSEEVTLGGQPNAALEIGDSGGLSDEETRVMSQAQARRALASLDDPTQTVTQRRPGAEVAAALASAGVQTASPAVVGPSPTIGASAPPPPPPPLLRAMAAAPGARGTSSLPRPARTPKPEPVAGRPETSSAPAPVRVEAAGSDRGAPATVREAIGHDATLRDPVDRGATAQPRRAVAATAVSTSASMSKRASARAALAQRLAAVTKTRRRILLAIAAVAVATGSFLVASAVLGGGGGVAAPDAAVPVMPVMPAMEPVEAVDAGVAVDAGAGGRQEGGKASGRNGGAGSGKARTEKSAGEREKAAPAKTTKGGGGKTTRGGAGKKTTEKKKGK